MSSSKLALTFICLALIGHSRSQSNSTNATCSASPVCTLPSDSRVKWIHSVGWRSSSSILYSCLATIFACSWSILQLNVPGLQERPIMRLWRKFCWWMFTLCFPELIAYIALAELFLAKQSYSSIKRQNQPWTLTHSFFTNMGGYVLDSSGLEPIPLNGQMLELLVQEGVIDLPDTTKEEINDRSKTDVFARSFAGIQSIWVFAQAISRRREHLLVAPLEVITAFYIPISLLILGLEWYKPKDINSPIHLRYLGKLDNELAGRLLGTYNRAYSKDYESLNQIKRIPFSSQWTCFNNIDKKAVPRWIRWLQQLLFLVPAFFNLTHQSIDPSLFTPWGWKAWRIGYVSSVVLLPAMWIIGLLSFLPESLVNSVLGVFFAFYLLARLSAARFGTWVLFFYHACRGFL